MAEDPNMTEYERLSEELRNSAGPLDSLVDDIQNGIELSEFAATKAGKIIIGHACIAARAALEIILDPNTDAAKLAGAVAELRVQHRVLEVIASTINVGKNAERQLSALDESQEQL